MSFGPAAQAGIGSCVVLESRFDPHSPLDAAEFERIEAAVAETERGRRFLAEIVRRHRAADTDTLLHAIARLEGVVTRTAAQASAPDGPAAPEPPPERSAATTPDDRRRERNDANGEGLTALAGTIARARAEIAAMDGAEGERPLPAADAFEAIVPEAERATAAILTAAEAMQEGAWTLREKGADAASCDRLDRRAAEIYAACAQHDLTARRVARALQVLRDLEQDLAATIAGGLAASDPAPERGPNRPGPLPPLGDDLAFVPADAASEPAPAGPLPWAEAPDTEELAAAFADLDRLSIEEKIALFS